MHKDINTCYRNWSTPLEAVKVMELLLTRPLFDKDYQDFIKQAMVTCETGKDRLPFPLEGTEAIIGHKTGTGDLNDKGQIIGINDVGFVYLPNGKRYTIAVFIKDSAENMQESSRIIADISQCRISICERNIDNTTGKRYFSSGSGKFCKEMARFIGHVNFELCILYTFSLSPLLKYPMSLFV